MSITNTRNFIEKWGCGTIVGIGLGVVMIGGLFTSGTCSGLGGSNPNDPTKPQTVLAEVSGTPIYLETVSDTVQRQLANFQMSDQGADPQMTAQAWASAIGEQVTAGAMRASAKKYQITVSPADIDAEINKQIAAQFDMQVEQTKQALIQQGTLKSTATPAEVEAELKKLTNKDLATLRKEFSDNNKAMLTDAAVRSQTETNVLAQRVQEAIGKTKTISDADLKASYETFNTKRIIKYFDPAKDQFGELERIRKEIEEGKLTFEQAMDKYTDDPPVDGKKSNQKVTYERRNLDFDPAIGVIKDLKPGEMTAVLNTSSGPAIYRLDTKGTRLPSDFETKKETYRDAYRKEMSQRWAFDELEGYRKGEGITWKSSTAKALFEWIIARSDTKLASDREALKKRYRDLYDALKSGTDTIVGPDMVSYARFGVYSAWYGSLNEEELKAARDERIEELGLITQTDPHLDTKLELATLAIEARKGDIAFQALKDVALVNAGATPSAESRHKRVVDLKNRMVALKLMDEAQTADLDKAIAMWPASVYDSLKIESESNMDYTATGQQAWSGLNARIEQYQKAGVLNATQVAEIRKLQAKWVEDKKKYDADMAKAEADAKKAAEEADKKAQEGASKSGAAPAPSGTPAPSGGTSPLGGGTTGG